MITFEAYVQMEGNSNFVKQITTLYFSKINVLEEEINQEFYVDLERSIKYCTIPVILEK